MSCGTVCRHKSQMTRRKNKTEENNGDYANLEGRDDQELGPQMISSCEEQKIKNWHDISDKTRGASETVFRITETLDSGRALSF